MKKKFTLPILMLVMIVNALSYGIIIPLFYPYAKQFGLSPLLMGALFASFSFFQFLATPIMGRLSDRYGRKPLLTLSLLGTSASLALFASASTVPLLFIARILDGVTGGNNSVAQAVIADSLKGKERTKAFGLIGASYGLGFMAGPFFGGYLSTFSLAAPFWAAGGIALAATVISFLFLPETNKQRKAVKREGLFRFDRLITALGTPVIGSVLLITFLSATASNTFILGYQTHSVDVMQLDARTIGNLYTLIGLSTILMQSVGMGILLKVVPDQKRALQLALLSSAMLMVAFYEQRSFWLFAVLGILYMITFAPQMVITPAIISQRTKKEDQGMVMGINQSYLALGQVFGPLFAGLLSVVSPSAAFLGAAFIFFLGFLMATRLQRNWRRANL